MKFSLVVLTAGLLVAIAAAGPISNVNVFGKTFGILGTNLEPTLAKCSDDPGVGRVLNFELTDTAGVSCGGQPCRLERGQYYAFIYKIECGAAEITWKLDVVINYIYPITFTLYPVEQQPCNNNNGQVVDLIFVYKVDAYETIGEVAYKLKLVGAHDLNETNESCRILKATVVPAGSR